MTIASEIQNYANGLSDAYGAVNDMGGVIPQDKNMNNLDTAIRTIPQTPGGSAVTFFYFDETTHDLYKESTYTTVATITDVLTAYNDSPVVIKDGELNTDIGNEGLTVTAADSRSVFCLLTTTGGNLTYDVKYEYDSSQTPKWVRWERTLQRELTAGSNISINGTTISATDTTYSDFTGATSLVAGTHGLVPAPTTSDPDKFLKGDGTWANIPSTSTNHLFYYDGNNINLGDNQTLTLYKDLQRTTTATYAEVYAAIHDGGATLRTVYHYGGADDIEEADAFPISLCEYTDNTDEGGNVIVIFDYAGWKNAYNRPTAYQYVAIDEDTVGYPNLPATFSSGTAISYPMTSDIPTVFTGATASVAGTSGTVPAPAAGDQGKALLGDGTWGDPTAKLVEMSYGEANAWTKFINAYNAGSIVYCRASSNANPATGSQTRKAFMAYVNNAATPTSVEFQYVRSVSSKTEAQPVDQVFVYTLTNTNGGTWSVASRNMGPKIAAGAGISVSYNNGTYTISLA